VSGVSESAVEEHFAQDLLCVAGADVDYHYWAGVAEFVACLSEVYGNAVCYLYGSDEEVV
jgi:hypothetical protein